MRANEKVYEGLRRRIIAGEFAPGMHLSEPELCALFQVSRSPIRVALQRLAEEGLVETESHRGAFVAELSQSDIDEVFDLRVTLEARAAGLAALRRTEADIDLLTKLVDDMASFLASREEDFRNSLHLNNQEFHLAVVAAARSPRLYQFTSHLMSTSLTLGTFFTYSIENIQRSLQFHRDIVGAISSADKSLAESLMSGHLILGHREFIDHRSSPLG